MKRVVSTAALAPKVAPIPSLSPHRRDGEIEAWICERLHLRDLFAGVTDTATRAARLKVTLLQRGLTESIAGRLEGKPVTWRAVYERLYHEPLGDEPC